MSKAKAFGLVFLLAGLIMIPTGLFLGNYIKDELSDGVPEALIEIRKQATEEIEDKLEIVAIADALEEIKDLAYEKLPKILNATTAAQVIDGTIEGVTENVYAGANATTAANVINGTLDGVIENIYAGANATTAAQVINGTLDGAFPDFYAVVNASVAAQTINGTLDGAKIATGIVQATEDFFNLKNFSIDYFTKYAMALPMGISENMTGGLANLSFTVTAQNNILYGAGPLPGLIQDLDMGMGVLGFLELYLNATTIGEPYLSTMTIGYNATIAQLGAVAGYITGYLWDIMVPLNVFAKYGITPAELAIVMAREYWFNDELWTVTTMGQAPITGVSEQMTSGTLNMSFTPTAQSRILYGAGPLPGILGDLVQGFDMIGFLQLYLNATTIGEPYLSTMTVGYNATIDQLGAVAGYLTQYMFPNIVPGFFFLMYGVSITDYSAATAREWFFNDPAWSTTTMGLAPITGVSEQMTGGTLNMSFTPTAQSRILYGAGPLPGILGDLVQGFDMIGFLQLYLNATTIGDPYLTQMTVGYNATIVQLGAVAGYLTQYMFPNIVPGFFFLMYGVLITDYSAATAREWFFNDPVWSTTTMGLAPINGTSEVMTGGLVNLTFSKTAQMMLLYGDLIYPGVISDIDLGVDLLVWMDLVDEALTEGGAKLAAVMTAYNCTLAQIGNMYNYMDLYIFATIAPMLFQMTYGMTFDAYVPYGLYGQWSNLSLTGGQIDLLLLEDELPKSTMGLEVGFPIHANLTFDQCVNLWDIGNDMSLLDRDGMLEWWDAYDGDDDAYDDLAIEFGLSDGEMDQILDWLFKGDDCVQKQVLPTLFEFDQGMTMDEKALELFYEQWTRAEMDGDEVYEDGLPLNDEDPALTGFEVGIPDKLEIDLDVAADMWDEDNDLALTNAKGIDKWFAAVSSSSAAYNELKDEFDLDDDEMKQITNWLVDFRDKVLPHLAEEQLGYNPKLIRDASQMAILYPGAILAALGVVALIVNAKKES